MIVFLISVITGFIGTLLILCIHLTRPGGALIIWLNIFALSVSLRVFLNEISPWGPQE